MKSACLSAFLMMVIILSATGIAHAQSNDFSNRLNRLENEIETLNKAVYRGEKPPIQNYNVTNDNNNSTAQMEVRLQQMEVQMRELTGRIEEQIFTINKLKQDVSSLQAAQVSNADTPKKANLGQVSNDAKRQDLQLDWKDQQDQQKKTAVMPSNVSSISTGDATALYESAYASLKNKEYVIARGKFENFLSQHPDHVLSANSKYWLGETYYVEGDFKQAARIFAQGFQTFPDSAKSPDMLLKLGLSLSNTGKKEEACIALSQLPVRFKAGPQNILDRGVDEMDKLGCSI